ncbi:hypothetical protein GW835_03890 [archaeon]|nr:hypothetical protein [archaeon]NCP79679.1 hypothetical protein [archaeon]NCP97969.1 hypothetical protein [archaeon]NCQ07445.1 hypothetical protein [archaeon]NCT58652.1 hypothetical protein [archaeon]
MIDAEFNKILELIFLKKNDSMTINIGMPRSKIFKDFINNFTKEQKKEIIEITSRVLKGNNVENKREVIRDLLLSNYVKVYRNKDVNRSTISQLRNLDKGFFLKNNIQSLQFEQTCNQTYKGFLRALKSDTLQTTKVKIDGKLTRVFIKDRIGEYGGLEGRNWLFINPQNLNVYSFKSDQNGKITNIFKRIDFEKGNIKISQEVKQYAYAFKKELYEKIKETYFKNKKPISFKKEKKKTIIKKKK